MSGDDSDQPGLEEGLKEYLAYKEHEQQQQHANGEDRDQPPLRHVMRTKTGFVNNIANVAALLDNEPTLRGIVTFDEMFGLPILRRNVPDSDEEQPLHDPAFQSRPMTDVDVSKVQIWLQRRGRLTTISENAVRKGLLVHAYARASHPVRIYLNKLKWDGKERLDNWLHDYLDADDSNYTRIIGPMFFIAMIARIMRPGCKADYMLILEGPQGILKSQACHILGGNWFSESLPELLNQKDAMLHLAGKWLIELAEMHAVTKVGARLLKSFLTAQTDRFRPPYGHAEIVQHRQCIFIGTTNEAEYLSDQTGNRRFWPVHCGAPDIDGLKRDRDQLFAEALRRFQQGEPWWPDVEFESQHIKPEQEQRREIDPWEEAIGEKLDKAVETKLRIIDVWRKAFGLEIDERCGSSAQHRIRNILERKGWVRGEREKTGRMWRSPSAPPLI